MLEWIGTESSSHLALLIRMSSLLKLFSIFSTAASTDVVFVTSSSTAAIVGTASPAAFAVSKTSLAFTSDPRAPRPINDAPALTNATATAIPMPLEVPAIKNSLAG